MIANFGGIIYEGTPQELKEYFGYVVADTDTFSFEGEEGFTVIFRDCDGEEVSEELVGDDAAYLEPVIQAFLRAYEKSGFCNGLSITIENKFTGDKTYKVEAKV